MSLLSHVFVIPVLLVSFFAIPAVVAASFPTGLVPPTKEEVAWADANVRPYVAPARRAEPSPRVVNIDHLPPVGNQIIGSCTSWATCYYLKSYQEAREQGWSRPLPAEAALSPAFVYNFTRVAGAFDGSSFEGNLRFLERHGTCPYVQFPETGDIFRVPEIALWKDAASRRALSYSTVWPTTTEALTTIKDRLAQGDVLVTGMSVDLNFTHYYCDWALLGANISDEVYYAIDSEGYSGEHALCIIGYDDTKTYFNGTENRSGAFLLVNSWGTGWGVSVPESGGERGYVWIAYDYFLQRLGVLDWPFYVVEDRIGYDPNAFAILSWQHGNPGDLAFELLGGWSDNPEVKITNLAPCPRQMTDMELACDFSEIYSHDIECWSLRVKDYPPAPQAPPYAATGTIRRFALDVEGEPLREAAGVPLDTEDYIVNPPTNIYDFTIALFDTVQQPGTSSGLNSTALGDWDGDGDLDIAANGRLLANDGRGNFSSAGEVMPGSWHSAAFGDYDEDGLPDLAIGGVFNSQWGYRILRNRGSGVFREESVFVAYDGASPYVFWIDWDRDGKLDLLTGSRVNRNLGNGTFQDSGIALPVSGSYTNGIVDVDLDGDWDLPCQRNNGDGTWTPLPWEAGRTVVWGDYNADGLPDAAIPGSEWVAQPGGGSVIAYFVYIMRNDGNGNFTQVQRLYGAQYATPHWGDINNDGRLDLLVSGLLTTPGVTNVWYARFFTYCQKADGSFHNAAAVRQQLGWGPVDSADLDGDGDLDLVYGGSTGEVLADRRLYVALNSCVETTPRPNRPPGAPAALNADVGPDPGVVTLRWDNGSDDLTAAHGLRYQVRVGVTPGDDGIISNNAGIGQTPLRIAGGGNGLMLRERPAGTVYWSVRTVDTSGAMSPWSAENSATIINGNAPFAVGDANADRVLDVSDIIRATLMAEGIVTPDPALADTDFNGAVTPADVPPIARCLFGVPIRRYPDGVLEVGPEGGTLTWDNIEITIPENAFVGERAVLRLSASSTNPFGWYNGVGAGDPRILEGVPEDFCKPLLLKVRDNRPTFYDNPQLWISEPGYATSTGATQDLYHPVTLTGLEWPYLYATLEPMETVGKTGTKTEPRILREAGTYRYSVAVLGGYGAYTTTHFSIGFPNSIDTELIEQLAEDLEDAYDCFQGTLGMSYARRTRWPIDVGVQKLKSSVYGCQYCSVRGDNYSAMLFNMDRIGEAASRRTTAYHEFFHMVQSWYDPRDRISKGLRMAPTLVLDEATAVWAEAYGSSSPDTYVSPINTSNWTSPFSNWGWWPFAGAEAGIHQDEGYGLASLIRFLEKRSDSTVVRTMYEEVARGQSWVRSVGTASGETISTWMGEFYTNLLKADLYPPPEIDTYRSIPRVNRTLLLRPNTTLKVMKDSLPPLSARLFMATAHTDVLASLGPDHKLGVRLDGTVNTTLYLLRAEENQYPHLLGSAPVEEGVSRYLVEDAGDILTQPKGRLLACVINDRYFEPPSPPIPVTVTMALLEDMELKLPDCTIDGYFMSNPGFPTYTCRGNVLKLPAVCDIKTWPVSGIGNDVMGRIWNDPNAEIDIYVNATLDNSSWLNPQTDVMYVVNGIKDYLLTVFKIVGDTAVPVVEIPSSDGHFTIPATPIDDLVFFGVTARYDVIGGGHTFNCGDYILMFYAPAF